MFAKNVIGALSRYPLLDKCTQHPDVVLTAKQLIAATPEIASEDPKGPSPEMPMIYDPLQS